MGGGLVKIADIFPLVHRVCITLHTENLYCHEQHKPTIGLQIRMGTEIFSIVQEMDLTLVLRPTQEDIDIRDI